uniref:Putative ovule protein n=1 Tax=Solanum chacoense TaxID=4108 RepID=A0A0V0GPR4_SOLCH
MVVTFIKHLNYTRHRKNTLATCPSISIFRWEFIIIRILQKNIKFELTMMNPEDSTSDMSL